jgi:hypothetical protein
MLTLLLLLLLLLPQTATATCLSATWTLACRLPALDFLLQLLLLQTATAAATCLRATWTLACELQALDFPAAAAAAAAADCYCYMLERDLDTGLPAASSKQHWRGVLQGLALTEQQVRCTWRAASFVLWRCFAQLHCALRLCCFVRAVSVLWG